MKFHKDGTLPTNGEIFVFGSNLGGYHGSGAARAALDHFGAMLSVGVGPWNRSYAIPTKNETIEHSLSLGVIQRYVMQFIEYAQHWDDQHDGTEEFFVTAIGCGLAGYKPEQIAPMFKAAPSNCSFPDTWKPYLQP